MRVLYKFLRGSLIFTACLLTPLVSSAAILQTTGELHGQITDEVGGLIVGATVTMTDANGVAKTKVSDGQGEFVFSGLAPGQYNVRVSMPGFVDYENAEVEVRKVGRTPLKIKLIVALGTEEVTISNSPSALNTASDSNAGALVLRGSELDALPDDPDELAAALHALAGPSAGLDGGQLFVDNFTDVRVPPRNSIREIRINANPFSAEFTRLGSNRVEIFTRPGTTKTHGQAAFNFSNQALNSRNPFANNRARYQFLLFSGALSGPINKRAAYFLDFERRNITDNNIINATILDSFFNPTPFALALVTPQSRTSFNPRFDYQLNQNNTLVARYIFFQQGRENVGVGNFSLPSRGYNTSLTEQTVQLTETAVLNQRIINETRFQYLHRRNKQRGDDSTPTINVLDAFTGGGSPIGLTFTSEDRFELQNYTTFAFGSHTLKVGVRLRDALIKDIAPVNFAGTYTFAGGLAPMLDANREADSALDAQTNQELPVLVQISSIERYRRTLVFQQQGLTPAQIRALGGGPTQFSRAGGNPEASIHQFEYSLFAQDEWNLRPNLTLSLGLRYEAQSNIRRKLNFAPRLSFAYAPQVSAQGKSMTVIRGGFGIFFDRFSETIGLQANHFADGAEQQFVAVTPNILDLFPAVPSLELLAQSGASRTSTQVAPDLQLPYTIHSSISIEQQLPYKFVFAATLLNSRALHLLRSRNINAPLPGTFIPDVPGSGIRPFGNALGNVFEYESSGRFNQTQLIISLRNPVSARFSFFATYILNKARSDTDDPGTFPADSYELSNEYGRSALDLRHRLDMGGVFSLKHGLSLNPFILAASGQPFNIITGRDSNGDTLFTERPSFASDLTRPNVIRTRFGDFQTNPQPGEKLIPRNYGTSPAFFTVNLRISKQWGFGRTRAASAPAPSRPPQQPGNREANSSGRTTRTGSILPDHRTDFSGNTSSESRYKITLSIITRNIFNRVNPGRAIGNLNSLLFGRSNYLAPPFAFGTGAETNAANRRIEAQLRFSF